MPPPSKEHNVTVFLSDLKVSREQSIPAAIDTNRRHFRGTVITISEEGGCVVIGVPAGFGSREASTILMTDIVSVRINA